MCLSESDSKPCSKCKEVKSVKEFHKSKSQMSGYACMCKSCDKKKGLAYRENNGDKIKKKNREYNINNRGMLRAKLQRWRAKNPEKEYNYHVKWA